MLRSLKSSDPSFDGARLLTSACNQVDGPRATAALVLSLGMVVSATYAVLARQWRARKQKPRDGSELMAVIINVLLFFGAICFAVFPANGGQDCSGAANLTANSSEANRALAAVIISTLALAVTLIAWY